MLSGAGKAFTSVAVQVFVLSEIILPLDLFSYSPVLCLRGVPLLSKMLMISVSPSRERKRAWCWKPNATPRERVKLENWPPSRQIIAPVVPLIL